MTTIASGGPDDGSKRDQIEKLRRLAKEHGLFPELLESEDVIAQALNSQRPKIKLPGDNRELSQFAVEIVAIVFTRHLYRRDRTPVVVNSEKKRLDLMTPEMLRTWVEHHLVCYKEKTVRVGDDKHEIQIMRTMNLDAARGTLESDHFLSRLREIDRVSETRLPVILQDGRIELLHPGYFQERGIYTFDDGLTLDEEMTIVRARQVIDELLQYFPFPNPRSKAVAIAAMLTMFCANMLPKSALRPGFIYTANSPGAGKTLLAKIAIIPIAGSASTRTFPRKEEAKKVLDVIAMDAANYALFDNIRGKIAGEEIEAFITSPIWEGRILGESTKFRVDNVATVFLTGNQSTTSGDMADRCLFVELFVQEADNRDRKIPHVIDDSFLAEASQRALILSALWAFVRQWAADGRPKATSQMPRFEAWSNIVAGIVSNAGYGDPIAKPELAGLGDVELQEMRELIIALAPEPPATREEWKFAAIIERVVEKGLFQDQEIRSGRSVELMFADDEITPAGKSYFGKVLGRYDKRLFGIGPRLLRFVVEGKGNSRVYAVIDETPSDDSRPF